MYLVARRCHAEDTVLLKAISMQASSRSITASAQLSVACIAICPMPCHLHTRFWSESMFRLTVNVIACIPHGAELRPSCSEACYISQTTHMSTTSVLAESAVYHLLVCCINTQRVAALDCVIASSLCSSIPPARTGHTCRREMSSAS